MTLLVVTVCIFCLKYSKSCAYQRITTFSQVSLKLEWFGSWFLDLKLGSPSISILLPTRTAQPAPTKTRNAKRNAKRNRTAERNSGILKCGIKLLRGKTKLLKCETDFLTKKKSVNELLDY